MRSTRWTAVAVVVVLAAVVALARPGATTGAPAQAGVNGKFSLILMVHTLASIPEFNVPATTPWNGAAASGATYMYRSIPCTGNAPVNNISSDLPSYNTRVAGSRAPSSLRAHPFEFRLAQTTVKTGKGKQARTQRVWEMQGRMTLTVCKLASGPTPNPDPIPDANKPKIYVTFRARFTRMTRESIQWDGTFTLAGGTQRYADLKGSGTIAGYFFCFAAEGCGAKGAYEDGQFAMQGTYSDPTPQLTQ